jgi:UDP-N-acetylmuramoylalanine--D-glutamate ligase
LKAKVAIVINVSPDHMDRYATLEDYRASKQRVYRHCDDGIVNADEPEIWKNLPFSKTPIEFTLKNPSETQWGVRDGFLAHGKDNLIAISDLLLQQRHNNQNFLAALGMGTCLQLPMESMLRTLKRFTGLEHRCQLVKKIDGVSWYNDSKATNVGAAIAAIDSMAQTLTGKLILLAGGDSKGVSLLPLQEPVKKHVSHVILFGKDADLLDAALRDYTQISRVATLREGVQCAKKIVQSGDVVLLAPACASLDQYENYAARGRDFVNSVEAM